VSARRGVRRRRPGGQSRRTLLATVGWVALVLAALATVPWRQTRGVEMERELRGLETERGIAEGERLAAERRIEELRSRARVVRVARDRLGMRIPEDREIVFLPAVVVAERAGGVRR
jgi:cell division protein FtsL